VRRRLAGAAAIAAALLGLTACESNIDRSAKIAAQGHHAIAATQVKVGPANRSVRVVETSLVQGDGGAQAVAVRLRTDGAAQAAVPVSLTARGAGGATAYTNDLAGIQPSLQQIALVAPGRDVWWVDDQVSGATGPKSLRVRLGAGHAVIHAPEVAATAVHLSGDSSGMFLTGTLTNRSGVAQANLPVFAVALRGGRVVAAGRAIVTRLSASSAPVRNAFSLYFVGSPTGADIAVTVAPTAAAGA
jgi:hypothetical protein